MNMSYQMKTKIPAMVDVFLTRVELQPIFAICALID